MKLKSILKNYGWTRNIQPVYTGGFGHRKRLRDIDTRIVVSGIRGKSNTVRNLHTEFNNRGYDVYSKVTGETPTSLYNEEEKEVQRFGAVRLYENELEVKKYSPINVGIFENQAITEYTTRLFNEKFVKPHIIFITNIREDHLETLGKNRKILARSFARSIPKNTDIIIGETDPTLKNYLKKQVETKNGDVTEVSIPSKFKDKLGSECVIGINEILKKIGETPMPQKKIESYIEKMNPKWKNLTNGRIFDASNVNDVQSTELIRQLLMKEKKEIILPLIYLREDRRGRTVSFLKYFEDLYKQNHIKKVHIVGQTLSLFENRASFPVEKHNFRKDSASDVLDKTLGEGFPVILVGNSVSDFMENMKEVIKNRSRDKDSLTEK